MAIVEVENEIYNTISVAFCIFLILVGICIAIYHTKTSQIQNKCARYLTIIMVLSSFLFPIIWLIPFFDQFNSMKYCWFTRYVNVNLYPIFKLIMYCVLVIRLHESYAGTPLGYNLKTLVIWTFILVVWTVTNVLYQSVTSVTSLDLNRIPQCQTHPLTQYIISMAFEDIVAGIINCYLFIKPLLKLNKFTEDFKGTDLGNIAIKQMILTTTTIATSITSLLCIGLFYFPQVFAGTDIIISTICILLMYSWNQFIFDTLYNKICCCCAYCLKYEIVTKDELNILSKTDTDTPVPAPPTATDTPTVTGTIVDTPTPDVNKNKNKKKELINISLPKLPSLKNALSNNSNKRKEYSKTLMDDNDGTKLQKPSLQLSYFAKSEPVQSNYIHEKHSFQKRTDTLI